MKQYLRSNRVAEPKTGLRRSEISCYGFWPSCGKEFSLGLWQLFQLHKAKWHCCPGLPPAQANNLTLLRRTHTFQESFPKGALLPDHAHLCPKLLPLSSGECGASRGHESSSLGGMCQGGLPCLTSLLASFSLSVVSLRWNVTAEKFSKSSTEVWFPSYLSLRESAITALHSMTLQWSVKLCTRNGSTGCLMVILHLPPLSKWSEWETLLLHFRINPCFYQPLLHAQALWE